MGRIAVRGLCVASAALMAGACSLGALDGFSGGEAGADPATEAGVTLDDGAGPTPVDAGEDSEEAADGACSPNARIAPTRVFDLTAAPVEQNGPTCNLENVLAEDGKVAGLDRTTNIDAQFAGQNVSSCVGVELPRVAQDMVVRLHPVAQSCTVGCTGSTCGTGHTAKLFAGTTESDFTYLREVELGTTSLADYTVAIDPTVEGGARFLAVCRAAWGPARDDIAIDAVYGRCR